ncbi:hypothetical protein GCM10010965_01530 [Caldalkalibacillus thermarum]|uniref:hypothetical protein n=1 Tax=Caldalkalibacillus thermarum TaxID=296745 RepID=UPI00166545F5|nr:hypothetical protein [Caldalkalibacillus thermarum]GGK12238.1 hypothetical protein GCM10010965_01530 [Caldalkalibacillus thermarum]
MAQVVGGIPQKINSEDGKEIGYHGYAFSDQEMLETLDELGVTPENATYLAIMRPGDEDFTEFDPSLLYALIN